MAELVHLLLLVVAGLAGRSLIVHVQTQTLEWAMLAALAALVGLLAAVAAMLVPTVALLVRLSAEILTSHGLPSARDWDQ
jgi:uncharacterized Tic20 family protein